jgi:hypothetical protein
VVDVPATATARVRQLSRGGRRKNDVVDAAAAASVAALHGAAVAVTPEGLDTVLAMLDERGTNLTTQRTRTVNQLHALLRELLPDGAKTDLTAMVRVSHRSDDPAWGPQERATARGRHQSMDHGLEHPPTTVHLDQERGGDPSPSHDIVGEFQGAGH